MVKKSYSKTGRSCWVTFDIPAEIHAGKAALCGDFNEWNPSSHPMKQRKDGRFSTTIALRSGQSYKFRYLVDGSRWENDGAADGYVPNTYGTEDSLLSI
jgi:1,4-alpha-glucan branching enzyme